MLGGTFIVCIVDGVGLTFGDGEYQKNGEGKTLES